MIDQLFMAYLALLALMLALAVRADFRRRTRRRRESDRRSAAGGASPVDLSPQRTST
jgi:putative copper export protein